MTSRQAGLLQKLAKAAGYCSSSTFEREMSDSGFCSLREGVHPDTKEIRGILKEMESAGFVLIPTDKGLAVELAEPAPMPKMKP